MMSNDDVSAPGSKANPVTYDETHTLALGLTGILAAIAIHLGFTTLAVLGSALLIAMVFGIEQRYLPLLGDRGERVLEACQQSEASKLLRIKPWYFIGSFIASGIGTYLVIEFALGGFGV